MDGRIWISACFMARLCRGCVEVHGIEQAQLWFQGRFLHCDAKVYLYLPHFPRSIAPPPPYIHRLLPFDSHASTTSYVCCSSSFSTTLTHHVPFTGVIQSWSSTLFLSVSCPIMVILLHFGLSGWGATSGVPSRVFQKAEGPTSCRVL